MSGAEGLVGFLANVNFGKTGGAPPGKLFSWYGAETLYDLYVLKKNRLTRCCSQHACVSCACSFPRGVRPPRAAVVYSVRSSK